MLLPGCATQRSEQFETFSKVGMGYADAIVVLTEEAGNVAIDADSQVLIMTKDGFSSAEARKKAYMDHTKALEELLDELRAFHKHTQLLKKYFHSLDKLATSDVASGVSDNTGKLIDGLQAISPSLKEATIGGDPIKTFMTEAVELSISAFQHKALERELQTNAKTIERELELQHAFLSALAIELEADFNVIIKAKTFHEVANPYIAGGKLPRNWLKNRRDLLSSVVMMGSVDNAKEAAKELKNTFVALVGNTIEPEDFDVLFEDVNAMLDLIELIRGATTG